MPADTSPVEVAVNSGVLQLATSVAFIAINVPQRQRNTCRPVTVLMDQTSSYSNDVA